MYNARYNHWNSFLIKRRAYWACIHKFKFILKNFNGNVNTNIFEFIWKSTCRVCNQNLFISQIVVNFRFLDNTLRISRCLKKQLSFCLGGCPAVLYISGPKLKHFLNCFYFWQNCCQKIKKQWILSFTCCFVWTIGIQEQKDACFNHLELRSYRIKFKVKKFG